MRRVAWGSNETSKQPAVGGWQWWAIGIVGIGLAAILAAPPSILAQPELNQPGIPSLLPEQQEDQEGVETLTQGPIHEAFANPTDLDPTPGPVVARQPHEDIAEEPPEYMPEDSVWIPGYWIWDDERDDFLWVTGVARKIPPGMRYVPGYWIEVEGGFQRVSGFWTSADVEEIEYREPPPETLEAGPSSPAPAENHFWVPGNWNHYETGYRWRAGYWSPYQPDWVWVPARWVWTPAGCVYIPGFWDYRLSYRGTIFAPVYFTQPIYTRPNWVYRPWCSIPTSNLFIHLWVRPNYCHYYFGNYYGPRYTNFGFHSWCHYPTRRYHYDPFFTYCNVHYRRQGIDFVGRVRGWHDHYHRHEDRRPARTWREQQTLVARHDARVSVETQLVARPIHEVARRGDAPIKLAKVDDRKRQSIVERTGRIQELNRARKQVERESATLVQIPRGVDSRPGRDIDDRGPGRGKADDRDRPAGKTVDRDDLPGKATGKAKGVDDPGGKARDRDDLPGKGKTDDTPDRPAGKGKADDRDVIRDKGADDRGGKGRDDKGGKSDQGGKGGPLIDRIDGAKKSGRGPAPKLKLPQEPSAGGRSEGRPGSDTGKGAPGRRDTIPPPMPRAGDDARPGADRPAGDRSSGGIVGPPGSKGKSAAPDRDRDDGRGPDRGAKSDVPRPRAPDLNLPSDDRGGAPKGKAKADLPGAGARGPDRPEGDLPRIGLPGDRSSGGPPKAAPKLEGPPARQPKGPPKADSPRTEAPRPNRPSFEAPKGKADAPKGKRSEAGEGRQRTEAKRMEIPNLERPRETPRAQSLPRIEPRVESSRPAPRVEAPRPAPRLEGPPPSARIQTPRPAPRVEAPRPAPRVESPRFESPRPSPRIEAPRPAPRDQSPRPSPRIDAPRPSPRVEAPRPTPRNEAPRIQSAPRNEPPRNVSPRVSSAPPRIEAPRAQPDRGESRPGGSENRNRGKGKNRD